MSARSKHRCSQKQKLKYSFLKNLWLNIFQSGKILFESPIGRNSSGGTPLCWSQRRKKPGSDVTHLNHPHPHACMCFAGGRGCWSRWQTQGFLRANVAQWHARTTRSICVACRLARPGHSSRRGATGRQLLEQPLWSKASTRFAQLVRQQICDADICLGRARNRAHPHG